MIKGKYIFSHIYHLDTSYNKADHFSKFYFVFFAIREFVSVEELGHSVILVARSLAVRLLLKKYIISFTRGSS